MDLTIKRAVYVGSKRKRDEPRCEIEFADRKLPRATLGAEVAKHLERGLGIFLGGKWGNIVEPYVVGKVGETTLRGFTTDEGVVAVAEQFNRDINGDGEFVVGKVIVGE